MNRPALPKVEPKVEETEFEESAESVALDAISADTEEIVKQLTAINETLKEFLKIVKAMVEK